MEPRTSPREKIEILHKVTGGPATAIFERACHLNLAVQEGIKNMKHRWPKSVHSQIEAVFHSIRSIRQSKADSTQGIRSFGSWTVYRKEAHRLADFMILAGVSSLLDGKIVGEQMDLYLAGKLDYFVMKKRSRQTLETILSSLGKFIHALENYCKIHDIYIDLLDANKMRMTYYGKSKQILRKSSKIFDNRAFPDPVGLISKMANSTFQLQACLQLEGGLRTEGVGAPSNGKLKNPLKANGLRGVGPDPVTGLEVGIVASVEKGGKETEHYISIKTYQRLEEYLHEHGKLESDYSDYLKAINAAAKMTGQYISGRGSHGLKHCFAQERYLECVAHGFSHEQALQQTSLETSHFRMSETLTYTRG